MIECSTMGRAKHAAIPFVVLLAACGAKEPATPPTDRADTDSSGEAASKIPVRGIATTSGGITTFCECGAPAGRVLTLADRGGELAKAFASLGGTAQRGLYLELEGAPDADGKTFAWTSLLRARALGEALACDAPVFEGEFTANGNKPFWAIEIRENGITYREPGIPKGITFPYAFTRTETGAVLYATKTGGPVVSTLEVALEPARCVDSMSREWRSFKAHVVLDGRKLEGCARAGVPHGEFGNVPLDELSRFAGAYPHTVQLWRDPALSNRLETLLGTTMNAFLENMKVQSPLMKDNGLFYVMGNKPHQGGLDSAFFLADPASDTIAVILFVNGSRRDFKEGGREIELPAEIVTTIGNMAKH